VIVIIGSRHDSVAQSIVATLPAAALCSAEDLTRPGWVWSVESPEPNRWVVDGKVIDDHDVTGVLVRRTYVYPEEFVGTHPDDREYLAAESTAFLIFVLSRTAARVVNPVADGALGEDVIRPERWMVAATELGVDVAPLRLKATGAIQAPTMTTTVEVVGGETFGDAPPRVCAAASQLAEALGVVYAAFVFDRKQRLVAVSANRLPGDAALAALGSLLSVRRRA
jgi:hypothetical protein